MEISRQKEKISKLQKNFLLLDEKDQDYFLGILKTLLFTKRKKDVTALTGVTSALHLKEES